MQLMKQNGIQINNNNNNGVNSRTQLSERGAAPERRLAVGGEPQTHGCATLSQEFIHYTNDHLQGRQTYIRSSCTHTHTEHFTPLIRLYEF